VKRRTEWWREGDGVRGDAWEFNDEVGLMCLLGENGAFRASPGPRQRAQTSIAPLHPYKGTNTCTLPGLRHIFQPGTSSLIDEIRSHTHIFGACRRVMPSICPTCLDHPQKQLQAPTCRIAKCDHVDVETQITQI
jgi:hypothetical protein